MREEVLGWDPLPTPVTKAIGKRGAHGVDRSRLDRASQPGQPINLGRDHAGIVSNNVAIP